MNRDLAIGYIVCLSCGIVLGIWLLIQDVRTQGRWRRWVAIFFGLAQIALSVLAIVALAILLNPSRQLHWVDLTIVCTLQSIVYTNLARLLRVLSFPTWTTLLTYAAIIVMNTVDVIFYCYKTLNTQINTRTLYPVLLFILTAGGPVLAACLSYWRFRQHQNSGQLPLSQRYLSVLRVFISINSVAALCGLSGGLLLVFLQAAMPDNRLPQCIFLACLFTELVCTISFCSGTIAHQIIDPIRALPATRRPAIGDTESIEMVWHRDTPTQ